MITKPDYSVNLKLGLPAYSRVENIFKLANTSTHVTRGTSAITGKFITNAGASKYHSDTGDHFALHVFTDTKNNGSGRLNHDILANYYAQYQRFGTT